MIERVVIEDDWMTEGHRVYIIGRDHPGAPRGVLRLDGPRASTFEPLRENMDERPQATIALPADALDMLIAARQGVAAPNTALADALADAQTVRNRLLTLIERESTASTTIHTQEASRA